MKNLVLSHKGNRGYATMTILPPSFSIHVQLCKGEDCEDPDRLGFRISFGDGYRAITMICLFPIESDVEFVKSIARSANSDAICDHLLRDVMTDIATYIHESKQTDPDGDIKTGVYFPLDGYMDNWQEQLNSYIYRLCSAMNHKPSKE